MYDSTSASLRARLTKAVTSGDTTAVRRLLKGGVVSTATLWYDGSLLHEAVSAARPSIVQLLVDAKTDVNSCTKDGRTPLHLASRSGQEDVVRMLLAAGASVNAVTKDGRSALHIALWRGHETIALTLIDNNANVNHRDEDGTTALHWAAKLGLGTCIDRLVEAGASVNARDKHGRTALYEAVSAGANRRLVVSLIVHGADPDIAPKMTATTVMTSLLRQKLCDSLRLVDTLLRTGYHLRANDRIELRRTSLVSPARVVVWRGLEAEEEELVCNVLDRHRTQVSTLMQLCRNCVRKVVSECGDEGQYFMRRLKTLPLPTLLKDFVSFSADFSLDKSLQ